MQLLIKILAIIVSAFGGHLIEYPIAEWTRKKIKYEKSAEGKWMASVLGIMERGMCTASWFLGYPQFVGIWLSIKTVGSWGGGRKKPRAGLVIFYF